MAEAILNEEQRMLLERLRKKLGYSSDLARPEEDMRLYQILGDFVPEEEKKKAGKAQQKDGDMQALMRELKSYIRRIGPEDDLYDDALDVLQTIAPEAVGETKKTAEQADKQKAKEMEQMMQMQQDRLKDKMDRISSGLFHYEDKDGNFIPDEVDAEMKKDKQSRRKMEPEEVNQLLKGEEKVKRRPENTEEMQKVPQKQKKGPVV